MDVTTDTNQMDSTYHGWTSETQNITIHDRNNAKNIKEEENQTRYDFTVGSTADQYNACTDFQKQCQLYEARKSPICAVCHTYCVFYFVPYDCFKEVILIDPKLYKLFKTIALQRSKQEAGYSDSELCRQCLESVNQECEQLRNAFASQKLQKNNANS